LRRGAGSSFCILYHFLRIIFAMCSTRGEMKTFPLGEITVRSSSGFAPGNSLSESKTIVQDSDNFLRKHGSMRIRKIR
ncbi:MAG TPA: hypothetical protein DEP61_08280, partial [Lachnospiraceae bacterium]|nr:hypothetical protein [Lachnospiraceae bacterium]